MTFFDLAVRPGVRALYVGGCLSTGAHNEGDDVIAVDTTHVPLHGEESSGCSRALCNIAKRDQEHRVGSCVLFNNSAATGEQNLKLHCHNPRDMIYATVMSEMICVCRLQCKLNNIDGYMSDLF